MGTGRKLSFSRLKRSLRVAIPAACVEIHFTASQTLENRGELRQDADGKEDTLSNVCPWTNKHVETILIGFGLGKVISIGKTTGSF